MPGENSIENSKRAVGRPFQKGRSGNPGGRPRTAELSKALRACLEEAKGDRTNAEQIAEKLVAAALKGQGWAIREVWDRTEGRAHQAVELSGAMNWPQRTPEETAARTLELAKQLVEYHEAGKLKELPAERDE